MGGDDPYSSSKACVEILVKSMRKSFFSIENWNKHKKSIAVARAGNVIGGGDWSDNRIIPDIARSIYDERSIKIRYPKSTRPWQHVLDPLIGYIFLASKLDDDVENMLSEKSETAAVLFRSAAGLTDEQLKKITEQMKKMSDENK